MKPANYIKKVKTLSTKQVETFSVCQKKKLEGNKDSYSDTLQL